MIGKMKKYFFSVRKELGKVSWLNRQELTGSTLVVFGFCIAMALIVWGIDLLITLIVKLANSPV